MTAYREISCQTACNHVKGRLPYEWDLNIYRGCTHCCQYCFAQYSHEYLSGNYFQDIYVKTNMAERLEKQLKQASWKKEVINLGGVTDSYQPAEEHYRLMPEIWKLLIRYKNPAIVSTKSTLILRDFDLIAELANVAYVNVAATITSLDENVRAKLEPGAASYGKRFEMLSAFTNTKASVGLHVMPIIPYLTDGTKALSDLFQMGKDVGVDYVLPQPLNLRGRTREHFFSFIEKEYLAYLVPLLKLYQNGSLNKDYSMDLQKRVKEIFNEKGLNGNYMGRMPKKTELGEYTQISLFDT